jgi:hypothetical protein
VSADILTLPPRRRTYGDGHVYQCVLLRDDVSIGELVRALRFSGIVLTTHAESGAQIIHKHTPPDAA